MRRILVLKAPTTWLAKQITLLPNCGRLVWLTMEKQSGKKPDAVPVWLPPALIMPHKFVAMQPGQGENDDELDDLDEFDDLEKSSSNEPSTEKKEASAPKRKGRKPSQKPTRKTAHKLIEQRRREMMNKELQTLKNKLPVTLEGAFKVEIIQVRPTRPIKLVVRCKPANIDKGFYSVHRLPRRNDRKA